MKNNNNLKETFEIPEVEIIRFSSSDVITTSGFEGEDDYFDLPQVEF